MIKKFREKLKKLFESSDTERYRLDAACAIAGTMMGACSTSILLYSRKESKLRCSGRYIDPETGEVETGGNKLLLRVLNNYVACGFLYSLKETPSVENAHALYADFNQKMPIENCTTQDEFKGLVEDLSIWKEWYEKLTEEYRQERFDIGIDTKTVTGDWYKRLLLKEKGVPADILFKNLDEVEDDKKYYCMKNLEKELQLKFESKYYVVLPLEIGGRNFGVLRFLFPEKSPFIKTSNGEPHIEDRQKEFFEDMAHDLSLHLQIDYSIKNLEMIGTMHKDISRILRREERVNHEYVDEFLKTLSPTIEKLEIFPHHIIWQCVNKRVAEDPKFAEEYFLRNVTPKEHMDIPLRGNDFFSDLQNGCLPLPFSRKEFTGKVSGYFGAGELRQIVDLPISEGYSYIDLPFFPGSVSGQDETAPHWIFTLIYREDDQELIHGEDSFKFMEFFSDQLGLGWDKFLEDIADKIHKKIDNEISVGENSKGPPQEEQLAVISKILAREFRADWCAIFLADEQAHKLRLKSSNLDLSQKLSFELTESANILVTCYRNNKTLNIFGRGSRPDIFQLQVLKSTELEYCLCTPIIIGKMEPGIIALFRSKPDGRSISDNQPEYVRSPFSVFEANLLKRVQLHIVDIIMSYFTLQQRLKDMRNVIEQVTAPIKSLVGYAEDITKGKTPKEKILRKIEHIGRLSRVSLKYATNFEKALEFDSQQITPKKERLYDLRDYLIGLAIEYRSLIKTKCIHINVTKQTASYIDVYVDKELFTRALSNIIDNTIKYSFSPEERQKLGFQPKPSNPEDEENVLITAKEDHNFVTITISSCGLEILENERGKIFDREFRGVKAKERYNVGAGIGLFIARKIIELHDGKLDLVPGDHRYNTVFRIKLPKGEAAR